MRAHRPLPPLRLGLSWLIWLALLLPMAQSVAAWHGYSHVGAQASSHEHDKLAPNAAHCDVCLTAAAVTGGALLGALPVALAGQARHELPQLGALGVCLPIATLAYLSRAPPAVPR